MQPNAGHARRQLTQASAPGPGCPDTVAETANAAGLTSLLAAVQAAGLTSRGTLPSRLPQLPTVFKVTRSTKHRSSSKRKRTEVRSGAGTLSDPNLAYTVFAPTNEAFAEAATDLNVTLDQLLASPDLSAILENHLVAFPLPVSPP